MLAVNIYAFGKLKEPFWRSACAEYAKRLSAFCKINIIELAEAKLPENPGAAQIEQALMREAAALLPRLKGYSAALCIEGSMLSSEQLSSKLAAITLSDSMVNFCVGSSHGLHQSVKDACRLSLSMSPMTFPHQLARVMLLEQLYRALSIQNGGEYHK